MERRADKRALAPANASLATLLHTPRYRRTIRPYEIANDRFSNYPRRQHAVATI
jgi:hypothetical protein